MIQTTMVLPASLMLRTMLKTSAEYGPPSAQQIEWLNLQQTTQDRAPTTDVVTGTGDSLPSEVGAKRLHNVVNSDISKGHGRYDKHVRQKGADQEIEASEGAAEDEVIDGVVGGR